MVAVDTKPHHARSLAEVLVEGDHRGHYSHGLNRMGGSPKCPVSLKSLNPNYEPLKVPCGTSGASEEETHVRLQHCFTRCQYTLS